jgi:hypothetical protein
MVPRAVSDKPSRNAYFDARHVAEFRSQNVPLQAIVGTGSLRARFRKNFPIRLNRKNLTFGANRRTVRFSRLSTYDQVRSKGCGPTSSQYSRSRCLMTTFERFSVRRCDVSAIGLGQSSAVTLLATFETSDQLSDVMSRTFVITQSRTLRSGLNYRHEDDSICTLAYFGELWPTFAKLSAPSNRHISTGSGS